MFFPCHRAPHGYTESSFGADYVGASKDRDPIDVLTDDVMSGVDELIRRGIVDADRLYLYSTSTGATAIDQLLTQTTRFRAAVAHGGVADWLGYYRLNHPHGDDTIPNFLRGRRPEDSPELYNRISPIYHVDRISTPLILAVGEKDTRYDDTKRFYEALRAAGKAATFVVYPGQAHEILDATMIDQHFNRALEFFREH